MDSLAVLRPESIRVSDAFGIGGLILSVIDERTPRPFSGNIVNLVFHGVLPCPCNGAAEPCHG